MCSYVRRKAGQWEAMGTGINSTVSKLECRICHLVDIWLWVGISNCQPKFPELVSGVDGTYCARYLPTCHFFAFPLLSSGSPVGTDSCKSPSAGLFSAWPVGSTGGGAELEERTSWSISPSASTASLAAATALAGPQLSLARWSGFVFQHWCGLWTLVECFLPCPSSSDLTVSHSG